jgi:large subunit ribosomal protein L17
MRKFHKKRGPRKLFFKTLAHNLIMKGRIETTEAKAKEIRPRVEKAITLAKKNNIASLRLLLARFTKDSANKLFYEIAPKYKERNSGYLRILKIGGQRKRDAATKALIEFV